MEPMSCGSLALKLRFRTWAQIGERFEKCVTRRAFKSVSRTWFVKDFTSESTERSAGPTDSCASDSATLAASAATTSRL